MKVIVDGDAVFIASDDFVDLQVSDVTWVDVPESELKDYQRRDQLHAKDIERMDEALRAALRACLESLEHIEREMLPEGEKFAEWSHPANSMRMAREALAPREETK